MRPPGLEFRDHSLARAGFDWSAHEDCGDRPIRSSRRTAWSLRSVGAAVDVERGAAVSAGEPDAVGTTDDDRLVAAAGGTPVKLLDRPMVAEALWDRQRGRRRPIRPISAVSPLPSGTRRSDRLRRFGLDRRRALDHGADDVDAAVALLDAAVEIARIDERVDPDRRGRPRRRSRGDAVTALRWLQMAGVTGEVPDDWPEDEEPDADTLLYHARCTRTRPIAHRATVGRNDRCPCGSGKKYKACHLGTESFPLEDRVPWLSDKVLRFARSRPHVMNTVGALADDIAGPDDQASYGLASSPFSSSISHCTRTDCSRSSRRLARNTQLPDDGALTAAQWALTDRSVFEVERAGRSTLAPP